MFTRPQWVKRVLFNDSQDGVFYFLIYIAEREDGEKMVNLSEFIFLVLYVVLYLHLVQFELIY